MKKISFLSFKTQRIKKISEKDEVQRQINLQRYLKAPQECRPKLIATVTHHGNTLAAGHNTATAETSSGNICLFDDKTVRSSQISACFDT